MGLRKGWEARPRRGEQLPCVCGDPGETAEGSCQRGSSRGDRKKLKCIAERDLI